MNQHMCALHALGPVEYTAIIAVADMAVYFGRDGMFGDFKMVVAIEGNFKMLVMNDITNGELLAITKSSTVDESEMTKEELDLLLVTLTGVALRIPEEFKDFRPFP